MSSTLTPLALGYRWPAEWEPHRATWLAWPHNRDTWPDQLARVVEAFVAIAGALVGRETVCVAVGDEPAEEAARAALRRGGVDPDLGVEFHRIPTDDAWARDHGPIFVVRDAGSRHALERAVVDFRFDNWGGKYQNWDRDDAVARNVAELLGLPRFESDVVLEGGAIDGDGAGTILTTESCLLHPNRGGVRSRRAIEQLLHELLGAKRVLWLACGLAGDDTDGHVDQVARFVGSARVAAAVCEDSDDPNHASLTENRRRLETMSDARGVRLEVVSIPTPPPLHVGGARCPASYANFYLANGVALVPTFGVPSDSRALAVLGEVLAPRGIVPIPCRDLVTGLGAVHCVTQQEPEPGRSPLASLPAL